MIPELLSLPYSPWSERARWALDARGIHYTKKRFQPLLGEPALRFRLGRYTGNVSVPVLFTDSGPYADSLAIARFANTQGGGPDLFPSKHATEIDELQALSDTALAAGRGLALRRVLVSEDALRDLVPPPLRKLGGLALAIARSGVKRTLSKYGVAGVDPAEQRSTLHRALSELRRFLPKGSGARPLFGTLSYGDITGTQALSFVQPVTHPAYRIAPASRHAFEDPELQREFADLVDWRDALYAALRTP